ncbi:MAG: ArsS family sensor histidine kinase [Sulfurovaceae bacterium]|nr:ArsS family sensor histidine kinase [Sulfurovaceae bacterium]MDD5549127.1 ArsS family sensor histidine kinase [Sulfurovaceae bacterium]
MSIFSKITILFVISMIIMSILSIKTNQISNQNIKSSIENRYIQTSKELYDILVKGDTGLLKSSAEEFNFDIVDPKTINLTTGDIVYHVETSFGGISIINLDDLYYLKIAYLDDVTVFFDKTQNENIWQKMLMNYFILADVLILILIFVIIWSMLKPIKKISKGIEIFGAGDYKYRLSFDERKKDEISKLKKQFNDMAQNIETLITSRKQLLSDISHELRTPLAKAKLSLEMMESSKHKDILYHSIEQIDSLTNEILELERLNSNILHLSIKNVFIDDVLLDALSKMFIEEDELDIKEHTNFAILADKNYLSIAIKNLIDNALKYKTKGIVHVDIGENKISIKNFAKPLEKDFLYYLDPFTKENSNKNGYGLGLNIVKRILDLHGFILNYRYENEYVVFEINFDKKICV